MVKSEMLALLYERANEIRVALRSGNITQLHVVYALIDMYLCQPEYVRNSSEVKEAVGLLLPGKEKLAILGEKLFLTIKEHPLTSYDDVAALEDCCRMAELDAELKGITELTIPMLLRKILELPAQKLTDAISAARDEDFLDDFAFELFGADEDVKKEIEAAAESTGTIRTARSFLGDPQYLGDAVWPVRNIQNKLRQSVFGQDEAISAVVSGCFDALIKNSEENKSTQPCATFLFAGAPGVGKTFLAQQAARALHLPFRRFDMSSFGDKEAAFEFSGTDRIYKSAHEGLVTGFVNKHPRCVLLFDEIEKAHANIIHLFLQILDLGRLKDSYMKRNVSFKDTIIIFTTNAGRSLYDTLEPGMPMPNRKTILNALSKEINPVTGKNVFPEAICSRFALGNIVLFNPLGAEELLNIGKAALDKYAEDFKSKFHIPLDLDEHVAAALLYAEGGRADARSVKGRATNFISSEVYNWMRFADEKNDSCVEFMDYIKFRTEFGSKEIKRLFCPPTRAKVLLFSEKEDTYNHLESTGRYQFITTHSKEEAEHIIATEEVTFAICDISGKDVPTLNIEDIVSTGRQLMDTLVKENVPVLVYSKNDCIINKEERQALVENGASGFFDETGKYNSFRALKAICRRLHIEKMLRELGRTRKMLTFDCGYDFDDIIGGVITLKNFRLIPAIDAGDQRDIDGLQAASDITFDSIIGAEDAKEELSSFISYIKEPRIYAKNGIAAPKGIILYGPPGTGKTMLAKAFARECGATFIATQGNRFLTSNIGGGAREVKRLFALARKYAPSVLFIDEIDIVAQNRENSQLANDVVNALLNEMDGFTSHPTRPVFVLAATNFDVSYGGKSRLDPALLRRFDRRIFVDLPNKQERIRFIKNRLKKSNQQLSDTMLQSVALRSTGMSLSDLGSVIEFALRSMLRADLTELDDTRFDEAFETYCYGEKTAWDKELLHRIAVHETGHAVVSYLCGSKPAYLTVSGRGSFGGYMLTEEVSLQTKNQLLTSIRTMLAGRAAEQLFFGEEEGMTTGAVSDLRAATDVAMKMITAYGMCSSHGIMFYDDDEPTRAETAELCNRILSEELENAKALLKENKAKTEELIEALMQKNSLVGKEIEKILK